MITHWLRDILLFKSEKTLSFLLLFLVLLLFVVYPFVAVDGVGKYVIDVFLSLILISGTFVVERKKPRRVAFALLVASLLTRWASYAIPNRELLFANTIVSIVFFVFAVWVILGRVFAEGPVTRHRVEGAVAVYLLIGLIFGSIYALLVQVDLNAFDMTNISRDGTPREVYDRAVGHLTYFSFVTLTTVGYGDITPMDPIAKQFAVLEGLVGQLYPAILLARLVSQQVTNQSD